MNVSFAVNTIPCIKYRNAYPEAILLLVTRNPIYIFTIALT